MVTSREYDEPFFGKVILVIGQTGNFTFLRLLFSHGAQYVIFTVDSTEQQAVYANGFDV